MKSKVVMHFFKWSKKSICLTPNPKHHSFGCNIYMPLKCSFGFWREKELATGHCIFNLHVRWCRILLYLVITCMPNLHISTFKQWHLLHTHPQVQKWFEEGFHSVRRSNRYWAGLSSDLIIEQVLMRSVKTSGGLTRGRGMNELQRSIWLLSTPVTAEIWSKIFIKQEWEKFWSMNVMVRMPVM